MKQPITELNAAPKPEDIKPAANQETAKNGVSINDIADGNKWADAFLEIFKQDPSGKKFCEQYGLDYQEYKKAKEENRLLEWLANQLEERACAMASLELKEKGHDIKPDDLKKMQYVEYEYGKRTPDPSEYEGDDEAQIGVWYPVNDQHPPLPQYAHMHNRKTGKKYFENIKLSEASAGEFEETNKRRVLAVPKYDGSMTLIPSK